MRIAARAWAIVLAVTLGPAAFAAQADEPLLYPAVLPPPYQTPMGTGIVDRLFAELFARSGQRVEVVEAPAERSFDLLERGLIDFSFGAAAAVDALQGIAVVPELLARGDIIALSRRRTALPDGWDSLAGQRVAYLRGWRLVADRLSGFRRVTVVERPRQLLEMLASDRVDAIVLERLMARMLMRQMGLKDVTVIEPPLVNIEVFVILHDRHAGLVPELDAALKAMKADGSYDRIWGEALRDFGIE